MSNIFCADCFVTRIKSLFDNKVRKDMEKVIKKAYCSVNRSKEDEEIDCETVCITTDMLNYMIKNHEKDLLLLVGNNLKAMARCEHARWNVENSFLAFLHSAPKNIMNIIAALGFLVVPIVMDLRKIKAIT